MKNQFNVSDISILVGYNKYKTPTDILDLIIKYFYKAYPELKYQNKFVSKEDEIKSMINNLSIEIKLSINNISNETIDNAVSLNNKSKEIEKLLSNNENQKEISTYINNNMNKNYGTISEDKTIKKYQELTNNIITNNNDQLYIYESKKYITRGKIDGICLINGEKYIIEIKNRKNRIFNSIPIYERIQIYYYMKSCKLQNVLFIQMLDDEIDETIVDDIEDELFNEVDERLNSLSDFINELSKNDKLRNEIIDKKNIDELAEFIYWI